MTANLSVPPVDDRPIFDLLFQRRALTMAALAQELGLFEQLEGKALGVDEIAAATGTEGRVTEAMLAVTTALGFLELEPPRRWRLSEFARVYLVASSPFFHAALLDHDHPELVELRRACLGGRGPTRPHAVAMEELSPEEIRRFIGRMHRITLPAATALGRNERFRDVRKLLDVGAGSGSLSIGIAGTNPMLRSTLLDLAPVCAIATENVTAHGLEDRISTFESNMFTGPWPGGHDAILFGNIFHDWDEASCRRLAARAFDAVDSGGRVFLHEMPLDVEKDGPLTAACLSVAMILFERGRQYTIDELHGFLGGAGFVDCDAAPSFGYYWLVSGRKPA